MRQKVFTIHNKELGEVIVRRDKRAKYFKIRPTSLGYKITVPYYSTQKQIEQVLNENSQSIKQKDWHSSSKIFISEEQPFVTPIFDVVVKKSVRKDFYSTLIDNKLTIEYPINKDSKEQEVQKTLWKIVEHFLILKAKEILPPITQRLAQKWNFEYSNIKIQRSKTRWGSCSSTKSINLSCYLMLVPPHLQEYVILHELCHTIEMNHSTHFWKLMDKVTYNQSSLLKKELKKYSIPNNY